MLLRLKAPVKSDLWPNLWKRFMGEVVRRSLEVGGKGPNMGLLVTVRLPSHLCFIGIKTSLWQLVQDEGCTSESVARPKTCCLDLALI